ncbi:hypothetical protein HK099_000387 [Clydaea vesicula]|uniref:Cation/H+ exchanger transmembrane domain-containing protein n=1 Tax=Clydaea vesicula TaxID=447962 RepID=A0AAD5U5P9_9FUNG|nr:hypothetical protein HK099_000387 [Clydaea vesicula]
MDDLLNCIYSRINFILKIIIKIIDSRVRQLLSAESASNDGCAFPLFQLAYFLMKYSMKDAFFHWSYATLLYEVGAACILGLIVGYLSRTCLCFRSATMLGISSFIAVLVTGITFSWDGWFAEETHDAHVQEVIDMLVNIAIIPWSSFGTPELPYWALITSSLLILIVRRLPAVLIMMKFMLPLLTLSEAFYVGWFGPVGVGALWYQTLGSTLFPENKLFTPVVSFIVFSSVICHGIMVPFVHFTILGIRHRTLSRTQSRGSVIATPLWPTGVEMSALAISGPVPLIRTADGQYVTAAAITFGNQISLKSEKVDENSPSLKAAVPTGILKVPEEIEVGSSESTLENISPPEKIDASSC